MNRTVLLFLLFLLPDALRSQMWNGTDTLYGNEWIDYSQTYYKIRVAQDGIYRVSAAVLEAAGFPTGTTDPQHYRLYYMGKQVPVFVSSDAPLGAQDFIEFYGEKNSGALDRHLCDDPDNRLINPWHSMFADTAAYFLCVENTGVPLRISGVANDLNNLPDPEPWCWFTTPVFSRTSHTKRNHGANITFSWFDFEGYCERGIEWKYNKPLPFRFPGVPAALDIRYSAGGESPSASCFVGDQLLYADAFEPWRWINKSVNVPADHFGDTLKVDLVCPNTLYIPRFNFRYARQFRFSNLNYIDIELKDTLGDRFLEIQSFNAGNQPAVIYDMTNGLRLTSLMAAGKLPVRLPAAPGVRRMVVSAASRVFQVAGVTPVQFRDYRNTPAQYIILSNSALFSDPENGGANHVQAYADYRGSAVGGGYQTIVVDINELYEQFAFGVRYHPMAVKNFFYFCKKFWPDPQYVLILGKGLDYNTFRNRDTQKVLADSLYFVPMFGIPGTDLPFVMDLNRISTPIMAIGRVPVIRPAEIKLYLDKVIAQEQQPLLAAQTVTDKSWMKKVVHLSGGIGDEQQLFRGYTQGLEQRIEGSRWGADVRTFYKTSNDPVQVSAFEQLVGTINEGAALWTIFGHSGSAAIDFDIGAPANYNNKDRYPLMMVLGCNSGRCDQRSRGLGEQYLLTGEKGAICYIASNNFSYSSALNTFAQQFYDQMGGSLYGATVGQLINAVNAAQPGSIWDGLKAVLHQNILQGDPAVRLPVPMGPDYVVDPASVRVDPNPVGLERDSFRLDFDLFNIGEHIPAELAYRIEQRFPNDSLRLLLVDTLAAPAYKTSVSHPFLVEGSEQGFNRFLVTLDPLNAVDELPPAAEQNNRLLDPGGQEGIPVYFYSDDVQPLYPPDFGIVNKPALTLSASSLVYNPSPARYFMEIDTSYLFDSPWRKSRQFVQSGGLLEWPLPFSLSDSTVYYWRVARDTLVDGAVLWRERSFIYLEGSSPGWNQSVFGQLQQNDRVLVEADSSARRIEFKEDIGSIWVKVAWRDRNTYPGLQNGLLQGHTGDSQFNSYRAQGNITNKSGVALIVVDPNTGYLVPNPGEAYHNNNWCYWFNTHDSLHRLGLMKFIDKLPDGYLVGLLAFNRPIKNDRDGYAPNLWAADSISYGRNLFQVLEEQGAKEVRNLANFPTYPWPYGLIFQKNTPEFQAVDTLVYGLDSAIIIRKTFPAKWLTGHFTTPLIGPALRWDTLRWQRADPDTDAEQGALLLYAPRADGNDSLLMRLDGSADYALDQFPADVFPMLRMRYLVVDTTANRTATQLHYWRIHYDPLPEGAVANQAHLFLHRDTLQQGDSLRFALAFRNVSDQPLDSLLVRFRIESDEQVNRQYDFRLRPLPEADTLHLRLQLPTSDLEGDYRLLVEANPDKDQPELYHFNNVWADRFTVLRDQRNPLLDVTFDGAHILDGDIVSPRPQIVITLKDENRFLALSDTALFRVSLEQPDGQILPLSFLDPALQFYPAQPEGLNKKNLARLEWRPEFMQDGTYRLLVNGRDASGNAAGAMDYAVRFQVLTTNALGNILNYPNPFSTSTCFVYTMTGATPPAHFRIQIMTVSGRVVREVTEAEFGILRTGTHQSDFCWDGRDQYGDQLANGVYLYRVIARNADGSEYTFREDARLDGYFKHGIGKMVLIR